jgi:hypothetical protein
MAKKRLSGPRISASNVTIGGEALNQKCHGNTDGVQPHDKNIIAHVRVMVLCWGNFYQDHPDAIESAYALCRDLVEGPYLNGLAQYGIGRGSMAGATKINFTPPPATLSEPEALDTLLGWLRDGVAQFGPAVGEASLLYVLFLPPQTKPTISSGQNDFGGYHSWDVLHLQSNHADVFWALIRTDSAPTNSGIDFIKSVSGIVSHEIVEAITNRDGNGYRNDDNGCEIGDLCEQFGTHDYRGWQVEQYWSQWDGRCINGENPVSLRQFLKVRGITTGRLNDLHTTTVSIEYIATQFR